MLPVTEARKKTLSRIGAGVVLAGLLAATFFARRAGVDAESVRRELLALGCFAGPAFLAAFVLGELAHLPGILFVVAARVVFGPTVGLALGYAGAVLALTGSFAMARGLVRAARATREPWQPKIRVLRRAFETLEAHPVRNVAILRAVFWLSPPLTYALAATKIRLRDHVLGCALGLIPPVVAANLLGAFV